MDFRAKRQFILVADQRERPHAPFPTGPNSFFFAYVFAKKAPASDIGAPSNGKSWTRQCSDMGKIFQSLVCNSIMHDS